MAKYVKAVGILAKNVEELGTSFFVRKNQIMFSRKGAETQREKGRNGQVLEPRIHAYVEEQGTCFLLPLPTFVYIRDIRGNLFGLSGYRNPGNFEPRISRIDTNTMALIKGSESWNT